MNWDLTYDVVVIGSGASGFSAAITSKNEGLETLLVEKEEAYGGHLLFLEVAFGFRIIDI